jgi:DNA-binding NarL/FixJ family response regulator
MSASRPVYVIDPHALFRRGVAECLGSLPGVARVVEADTVDAARADPALEEAAVAFVDHELPGAAELILELSPRMAVIACVAGPHDLVTVLRDGARGVVSKATVTPEALVAALEGTAVGVCVITPELLGAVTTMPATAPDRRRASREPPALSLREQRVMGLIADGHATPEVARRLSYSERTVKSVVHDVVVKLGARSRAEAVAHAVRDGLI